MRKDRHRHAEESVSMAGMTHIGDVVPQVLVDVALQQAGAHIDHDDAGEFEALSDAGLSTPVGKDKGCANLFQQEGSKLRA